jgi:hypothetical protein
VAPRLDQPPVTLWIRQMRDPRAGLEVQSREHFQIPSPAVNQMSAGRVPCPLRECIQKFPE